MRVTPQDMLAALLSNSRASISRRRGKGDAIVERCHKKDRDTSYIPSTDVKYRAKEHPHNASKVSLTSQRRSSMGDRIKDTKVTHHMQEMQFPFYVHCNCHVRGAVSGFDVRMQLLQRLAVCAAVTNVAQNEKCRAK